jgi:nitroreductase/dihydropteridine reductase
LSMNQKQIKDASHVLVICIEREVDPDYIRSYFNRVEEVRQTSRAILDPYEKYILDSFSEKSSEELELWMTKQAYLALGNLLTVCAVEEIDSCPMEGFEPEKYDALLGLESRGLKSVLVLPVGYRHKDDFFSDLKKVRRGVDRVIIDM